MNRINYISEAQNEVDSLSSLFSEYVAKKKSKEEHDQRIMLFSSLNTKFLKIYHSLNLSALAGEYVYQEKLENILKELNKKISDSATEIPENEDYNVELQTICGIISSIINDLDLYCRQIHYFRNSLHKPDKILIDDDDYSYSKPTIDEPSLEVKNNSKLFRLNLWLLDIDREFVLLPATFSDINRISHELSELKYTINEPYVDALLHKCKVLENKFYYCKDITPYLSFYNYYHGKDEDVDLKLNEIGFISKKLREINTRDEKKYVANISSFFSCFSKPSSTFDFFVACHYYKNIAHDDISLRSIEEEFRKKIPDQTLFFDKRNAYSCLSYLRNCRFSLKLEDTTITSETVESELKDVLSVQKQNGIENYFPYYKAVCWYKEYIDALLSNPEKQYVNLQDYIDLYESHLSKARKCLSTRARIAGSFIPYKPYFDECIEVFEDINIFISTSFIVPVDICWVDEELKKYESDLSRVKAITGATQSVKSIVDSVSTVKIDCDKAINKLKEDTSIDLKENLKNSIQILSIFAGIVIFASGSIQIFSSAISIKQAAIFMIMFAAALGLVGLLIRNCLVSREKWSTRDWVYLISLIFICIITGFGTFCSWGNDNIVSTQTSTSTQQLKSPESHRSDSLSINLVSDPIQVEVSTVVKNNDVSVTKQKAK